MTARTAARVAWSLWGLAMVLEVAAIGLWLAPTPSWSAASAPQDFDPHIFVVPGYATVGAVIAARRRNRIGWLFVAFGLASALLVFAESYFVRGAMVTPGSLPAARIAGWIASVLWPSGFLFLFLLSLLFPDGRLPSRRWRPVALALAISWTAVILNVAFTPGGMTLQGLTTINPMGIAALGHPTWQVVIQGVAVIAVVTLGAAALAPLLRFRRVDPVQRQQLKWFAFVIGICAASALVASALAGVLPVVATVLWGVAIVGVVVGLPVAVGLAILRYRLYDIDRLLNRAVVYAILTAVLGVGYAGAVLALGQLFGGVGERTPSGAVAGATLAVAALFQPARRRIQRAALTNRIIRLARWCVAALGTSGDSLSPTAPAPSIRCHRDRLDTGPRPLPVQETAEMHPSPGRGGVGARVSKRQRTCRLIHSSTLVASTSLPAILTIMSMVPSTLVAMNRRPLRARNSSMAR